MHAFRVADWQAISELVDAIAFDSIWHELAHLPTQTERLQHIDGYLITHLKSIGEPAHSFIDSIPLFNQTVVDPVKAIAAARGVSTHRVQLQLQTNLGYSAKELMRFSRFKQLIHYLIGQTNVPVDWLTLVDQFNYHDHNHLIRDFRYFLSMKPRQFIEQMRRRTICMSQSGKFY